MASHVFRNPQGRMWDARRVSGLSTEERRGQFYAAFISSTIAKHFAELKQDHIRQDENLWPERRETGSIRQR